MHNFKVSTSTEGIITIETDTYWSCKAEGNFMLSKYSGNGSDSINVLIPEESKIISGTVYFSFGNEKCENIVNDIYIENNCYIDTFPKYKICDDKKTLFFYFDEPNEMFTVSIDCFNGWYVEPIDTEYILGNNELLIFSPNKNKSEIHIISNNSCNGKNIVYIKLKKRQ